MRSVAVVTILLLSGVLVGARGARAGESVSFGVLGGLSRVDLHAEPAPGAPLSSRTRAHAGALVQLRLSGPVSLMVQALWLQKGASLGAAPDVGIDSGEVSAEFVGFPILVKLGRSGGVAHPYLAAGAEVAFKTGASLTVSGQGMTVQSPTFENDLRSLDVALDVCLGLEIPVRKSSLLLEVLYAHGVRNLARSETNSFDPGDVVETRALRVSAGVRF